MSTPKQSAISGGELPETVHSSVAEALVGLSDSRLRQLAEEGHFPPPVEAQYKLLPLVAGLLGYYKRRDSGELAKVKIQREQTRLRSDKVQADLDEGKVALKAEFEAAMVRFVMQLRARHMVLPRSLSRRLALTRDDHEVETVLFDALRDSWESTELYNAEVRCPFCEKLVAGPIERPAK